MNAISSYLCRRIVPGILSLWLLVGAGLQLRGQCLQGGAFDPGQLFKSTGIPALDMSMNQEATLIASILSVNPNMFLFNDGGSPNAYASSQNTLPGYTGTVYFGVALLRDELWNMNKGGYAVAGIMAHEFAHVLQARSNSRLSGKLRELHADFLAGYYLGRKNYIAPVNIQAFAASLYEKGDYAFWSPLHHGTPDERVSAMVAGLKARDLPLMDAFKSGEAFVSGEREAEAGKDEGSTTPSGSRPHVERSGQQWEEVSARAALRDVDIDYIPNWGNKRSGVVTTRITLTNNSESASYKLRFKVAVLSVSRDDPDDELGEVDSEVKTVVVSAGESVVVPVKLRWATDEWEPNEDEMPSFRGPDDDYARLKAWRSEDEISGEENEGTYEEYEEE